MLGYSVVECRSWTRRAQAACAQSKGWHTHRSRCHGRYGCRYRGDQLTIEMLNLCKLSAGDVCCSWCFVNID
jgi:hypothetical protein